MRNSEPRAADSRPYEEPVGGLDLITRAEAAEILTVSEKTVKKLIAAGKLPAYRISASCTRLRRSEVLSYVEASKVRTPSAERTVKLSTIKDVKRRRELEALGSGYTPGMQVAVPYE